MHSRNSNALNAFLTATAPTAAEMARAASTDAQARRMGLVPPAGVMERTSRLADIAKAAQPPRAAMQAVADLSDRLSARTPILDAVDNATPAIRGFLDRAAAR